MFISKLKITTAVLLAVGIICTGPAVLTLSSFAAEQKVAQEETPQPTQDGNELLGKKEPGPGLQGESKINPDITKDEMRVTIEGQLDKASELVLRIGDEKSKLSWTRWTRKTGAFKAVVELSDKIKLDDDSFGSGFVFSVDTGTSGSRVNVHLPQTGPMPSGKLSFREDSKIIRKEGVITFADIQTEDDKLVPVSILIRKASK